MVQTLCIWTLESVDCGFHTPVLTKYFHIALPITPGINSLLGESIRWRLIIWPCCLKDLNSDFTYSSNSFVNLNTHYHNNIYYSLQRSQVCQIQTNITDDGFVLLFHTFKNYILISDKLLTKVINSSILYYE